jgi:chromate transporter
MENTPGRSSPSEIAGLFLRLGLTAFGGPAAHLSLMQREFVSHRHWLNDSEFLDLTGACNLLPGPGSTQVAMAIGFRRAGWTGLLLAGCSFILPAALATLLLAWIYTRFGALPPAQSLLNGAKPAMLAILLQAVWKLGRKALHSWPLAILACAALGAALAGMPPLAVLLLAGALGLLLQRLRSRPKLAFVLFPPLSSGTLAATGSGVAAHAGLLPLLLLFLKLGIAVFGSGYVLLVFLHADLVERLHWITPQQLLDAVAAGQLTPGPVFATATFLGFLLHGWQGAAIATLAIFLPSFPMAAAASLFARRIRASAQTGAFLDGVNAAAIALMASVALPLGKASLLHPTQWGIAATGTALLFTTKINPTWILLLAAACGWLSQAGFSAAR